MNVKDYHRILIINSDLLESVNIEMYLTFKNLKYVTQIPI